MAAMAPRYQLVTPMRGRTLQPDVQAERARAIAEALQASGARSLMELLAESERHKEHLDKLCAKLEALPKIVKKKTRQ